MFKECGIVHETTVPDTLQQDGVRERANRTVVDKAVCILAESGLDRRFWIQALDTAVYVKNLSPTAALKDSVPEEMWTGHKVDVSHLRVFGCVAYNHVPKKFRTKLDFKTEPLIMVGYSLTTKNYKLSDPAKPRKII